MAEEHRYTALLLHNFYQDPGGEDVVFTAETDLLRSKGHQVAAFQQTNAQVRSKCGTAFRAVWNPFAYSQVRTLLASRPTSITHFHNTFPLISPSAYYAVASQGAAVVQTLHNYRLICPGALLSRDGVPCEDCITEGSLLPAMRHACYRNSRSATAAVAAMLTSHRAAGTYRNAVDAYIALSDFARRKFIAGGLPENRIFVKPNFVSPAPSVGPGLGEYALFVGRLAPEKGVATLIEAWKALPTVPLRVVGDGPLSNAKWPQGASPCGWQPREQVMELLRQARVLIFPSTWYESCPMTILEAFACGTPVIASNLGSMAEFVRHGETGLLFSPGDPDDLAAQVRYAFSHPEHLAQMRLNARREYEEKYTAERNYKMLIAIYEQAIENSKRRKRAAS